MEFLAHVSGSRRQSVYTHLIEFSQFPSHSSAKMNLGNADLVIELSDYFGPSILLRGHCGAVNELHCSSC